MIRHARQDPEPLGSATGGPGPRSFAKKELSLEGGMEYFCHYFQAKRMFQPGDRETLKNTRTTHPACTLGSR